MTNNNKTLRDILLDNGKLFPTEPEQVSIYLKANKLDLTENPVDYDNPLNIINRGQIHLTNFSLKTNFSSENDLANLAMVAREGKVIPTNILNKMKEDKKNAKNK